VTDVAPLTYQQVMVSLLDNAALPAGVNAPDPNECRTAGDNIYNCVVDSKGTVKALKMPQDAASGMKVPPGQIACGGLPIASGEDADVDLYFNSCASVVEAAGAFTLKPVIWARTRPHAAAPKP
jgi:hypothetical protein